MSLKMQKPTFYASSTDSFFFESNKNKSLADTLINVLIKFMRPTIRHGSAYSSVLCIYQQCEMVVLGSLEVHNNTVCASAHAVT